ncbi:MAG: YebC/PmpR family DNA-binding transcriptional regulator [Rickettsiales bacterium]|jgi:YebC/PmpR family DNA-binding regulatory protein|nr:YebC/PmpR family DNA-binding transcriptional regulator [Rickettsiales bacterium]
MSGHSKWATTKHKKGLVDAKRSKMFTKIQKEITVAAKMGDPSPDFNPRLRNAVIAAKTVNMPKDKIDSAIKRATGAGGGDNYDEIRYEGYATGGVALIVETLTDNKNRTASNIRSYFTKYGGSLAETGSVSFMFEKVGIVGYEGEKASEDKILEIAVDCGAENVESTAEWHEITLNLNDFTAVRDKLIRELGEPSESKITWKPKSIVVIEDVEQANKLLKLIDKIEDDDDVQSVVGNFEIPDDVMEKVDSLQ